MSTHLATKELRNMQMEDLRKEALEKQLIVAKMRVQIQMGKEKDTAKYLREKKDLARLLTIINESKQKEVVAAPKKLKRKPKTVKVPAPTKA